MKTARHQVYIKAPEFYGQPVLWAMGAVNDFREENPDKEFVTAVPHTEETHLGIELKGITIYYNNVTE